MFGVSDHLEVRCSMLDAGEFAVRRATARDVNTLVRHRWHMFADMGADDHPALDAMAERFRPWVLAHMAADDYLAWLAVAPDGTIGAGSGLWLMDWLPHMIGAHPRRGNIVNVYTERAFRRRGLARRLIGTALDWCRERGVDTVVLHASDDGRALYESLGFRPTNEMRLSLAPALAPPTR
jgi:GNAT superfamily N-acetyltransferase